MATNNESHKNGSDRKSSSDAGIRHDESVSWTNGLKQLYDSVVDEPLPDAFKDLLAQFDDGDGGSSNRSASDNGKSA